VNTAPGANVMKLFTIIIYYHFTIIPSFCVIKNYHNNFHVMAVNYCGIFTAQESIIKNAISNTFVIYHDILNLEKIGTVVNYRSSFRPLGPDPNVVKLFTVVIY
jgi:hypothetical protein